ncbi:trimeric intracellular cation channel family protein [Fluviibacter phosphoraccumulans]|uniref:Membrane protein n=1 Tax=Fluviibacter phosphoraccumulans TaxID=1751046 RepID=A0A679IA89_9RHOO|nr:trimeric intracellular cation channel family protein [Fluviibacter phosphoraccumulans]BBU69573.1 membrane protein [Fluviibacter phosphoraccumulans]BBU71244.1 membrane protein [Fluviibacter phosphoraccumulans]BCA65512.1 membrane protein [Fluviibacter phosphoraccumulans]
MLIPSHIVQANDTLIYGLGLAASVVCAVTGVLVARDKGVDLFGALMAGVATSLGGGTVRDLLLGRKVFWMADETYLWVTVITAMLTFFITRVRHLPEKLFLIPDAIGLALFAIVGTQVALDWNMPWLTASLLGVLTAVLGGLLRDVMINEVPLVFSSELYATAAWFGSITLIILDALGVQATVAAWAGILVCIMVRLMAIRWKVTLPRFKH